MDETEKLMLARLFDAVNSDLASHKAALDRIVANQQAEHEKMVELATVVNDQTKLLADIQKAWTTNFEHLGELVNRQSKAIEIMRGMLLPASDPPAAN
jgi:hypothetical protein